jgi:hypothetical protein
LCIYRFSSCDYGYGEELLLIKENLAASYLITKSGTKIYNFNDSNKDKTINKIIKSIYLVEKESKTQYPLSTTTQTFIIYANNKKFEGQTNGNYKLINYEKLKQTFILNNGN